MEREMIHYLPWDLTISRPDLAAFKDCIKANYKKGVPKAPYVVIPDKSCEKDSFGKGVLEERQTVTPEPASAKKPTPMPISIPSAPITVDSHLSTSSDPPPSYTTYPEDNGDRVVSPYLDSSSNSSHKSSPPSPGPKTPPEEYSSAPSTPGGKLMHIDFINPLDIKMKCDEICIHDECKCGVQLMVSVDNENERTTSHYCYFVLLLHVRPLTGESSLTCMQRSKSDSTLGGV